MVNATLAPATPVFPCRRLFTHLSLPEMLSAIGSHSRTNVVAPIAGRHESSCADIHVTRARDRPRSVATLPHALRTRDAHALRAFAVAATTPRLQSHSFSTRHKVLGWPYNQRGSVRVRKLTFGTHGGSHAVTSVS